MMKQAVMLIFFCGLSAVLGLDPEKYNRTRNRGKYDNFFHHDVNKDHRLFIGGAWNKIGLLQYEFLKGEGLLPSSYLFDLACGSFRGGHHFAEYLDEGHYFGLDLSPELIDVGYEKEFSLEAKRKQSRDQFISNDYFDGSSFGVQFDYILSVSLWTHLPESELVRCLEGVRKVMGPQSAYYTTVFIVPTSVPENVFNSQYVHQPGGRISFPHRDPYHFRIETLFHVAARTGMNLEIYSEGKFDHPRNQIMLKFTLL
mmetsp:Transcript_16877/g.26289  ORF Transcript_16877/g.26289 Transcript_16877/m.26289 type:complete len:256 (-) Transcript_16877:121-888(-)|eukprot:CAMPEP_0201508030 /NCGR_PEP_ID=MMETSP0161_2-20130828/1501_1 /ASSEMBLY_ACC=CAM_ASM_000251 /TAXON_ID=180227 /ORGANISM="Neoparamoeba aestuarina, Strain SoJaBio B1-5/56/2" /LENGTH=255 /DNA_ID=CAMNT_0047902545 /DNA_START=94 /DNA_END=861 /DNA_ORIENTATION=+